MATFNVLITDYAWPDLDIERRILAEIDAELVAAPLQDAATLAELAPAADAIMTCWAQVRASVLTAACRCRIVARLGIGLDNIDVACCTRQGILVTNVPDYCEVEVAEHALAQLLSMGRKVAFYHHLTKSGTYQLDSGPPPRRLEGQTLGVIGWGNIGRAFARKALGIGLNVLVFSRRGEPRMEGARFCDLERLLRESDFVSLHLPLTPQTRHVIGADQLAMMKPTAYLLNTARGGLVDHDALAEALEAGRPAGAALDVQDPEPPDLSQPPFNDPRVVVTPHAAFLSVESLAELRRRASRQVVAWLSGDVPSDVVNPDVLSRG